MLIDQGFHVPQRLGGLAGPAPGPAGGRVGDRLELTQQVGVAQHMAGHTLIGVIGAQASWTANPAKVGNTPAASMAAVPFVKDRG